MKKTLIASALVLGCLAGGGQATPDFEALTYRAYLGGIPLGELNLGIARDERAYRAQAEFRMVALLRLVFDTDARAQVVGRIDAGAPRPQSFTYWVRDRDERRTTEILFDADGRPKTLNAEPPFRKKDYGMTLAEAAGAVDPATAAVALSAPRDAACDFAMDVFDGRKRHRISLRDAGDPSDDGTVRCAGLYERVAGFKAKHMTPERRSYPFNVRFEAAENGRWQPVRVWADTDFGSAVVSLVR